MSQWDKTCPVRPAIPPAHNNGAVLNFSPIEVSKNGKAQINLLLCVVVAPDSLCLMVTAFKLLIAKIRRFRFLLRNANPECSTNNILVEKIGHRIPSCIGEPGDQLIKLYLVRENGGLSLIVLCTSVQTLDAICSNGFKKDPYLIRSLKRQNVTLCTEVYNLTPLAKFLRAHRS